MAEEVSENTEYILTPKKGTRSTIPQRPSPDCPTIQGRRARKIPEIAVCMHCNEEFEPASRWNRFCVKCSRKIPRSSRSGTFPKRKGGVSDD